MTLADLITVLSQCPEQASAVRLRYVFRETDGGLGWIDFDIADVHEDGGIVLIEGDVAPC